MRVTAALAARLAALTEALDDPGADIEDSLRQLGGDARVAVVSYIGLSVLVGVVGVVGTDGADGADGADSAGTTFAFTVLEGTSVASDARSSIALRGADRSSDDGDPSTPVTIVLYASTPGAFVHLAADLTDLARLAGQPADRITVDEHVLTITDAATYRRLEDLSTANQAIGVLLAQARTPEQADRALELLADVSGIAVEDATAVLNEMDSGDDPTAGS